MRPLVKGDKVGLAAPSSPVEEKKVSRGVEILQEAGFSVEWSPDIFSKKGYLAGDDERRAEEINGFIRRDDIQAIFIARGGYGISRILDRIDFQGLVENPKPIIGFSDSSSLISHVSASLGIFAIHGTMAATGAMMSKEHSHRDLIFRILKDEVTYPFRLFEGLKGGKGESSIEGKVCGGCLSVISSMLGTVFFPGTERKILFLEEVGEKAYRVDRMMNHLRLAGAIRQACAVLAGRFVPVQGEREELLLDIVEETCRGENVPFFKGFPGGHLGENLPLPLGVPIRIEKGGEKGALIIIESPFGGCGA